MYRPNFCAECGEKVTRSRWRVWTSRSFCQNCEGPHRRRGILVPLVAAAALLSMGLLMGRVTRPQPPPLSVQHGELPVVTSKPGSDKPDAEEEDASAASSSSSSAQKPEPKYGPDGTETERPTDPQEIVSLCGARTQKGTPCQRRVRGTGRCWQHRGMPAILPPGKLVIQGQ
ncbi:MAG TPA: hypothetical protein VJS44_02690 [Pyrinomonadaceae bacterium]|nr:hypothetical protein [Pyrinomonadaceae bacterium]